MDPNQTNENTELNQNDVVKVELDDTEALYAAISEAVAKGDNEALDRLMKGEVAEVASKEAVQEEPAQDTETEEASEDEEEAEDDESEQPQKPDTETDPEAAKSAASTTPAKDDIEALKRELHALRSDAGRVRHVQSRMHQLENELRAYRARDVQKQNEKPATATKAELPAKLQEKIKNLKEIDPDLAETFETLAGMVQDSQRVAEQTVEEKIYEQQELEFFSQQRSELLHAVPQADAIFATPQWTDWKNTLTPGQRAMAESGHAVDVIRAIHAFAADMKALQGQGTGKSASSEGGDPIQTNAPTPTQTPKPEVVEARNRKLSTAPAAKTPAAKQVKELDEQALYSEFYQMLGKQHNILK